MANGIDFNPEPAYGSNPFQPMVEGINLGFGIQQQLREQQKFQQEIKQREEEKKILAAERRGRNFNDALTLLKDRKFREAFPTEMKDQVIREKIAPYLIQDLGIEVDKSMKFADLESVLDQGIKIFESSAPMDMKKQAVAKLMLRAEPEEQKQLQGAANLAFGRGGIARQTGKVTDTGLPLFFNPDTKEYAYNDPETGEPVPYRGIPYPPPQNPSAGAETDLREVFTQRSLVNESLNKLTDDKIGLIDKRFKTIGAYIEESSDPEAIYFRSITELANTIIRKNFYGATLTDNEQKAFSQIAANRDLSPSAFRAQLKAMKFSFDKIERGIKEASGQVNRPFRENTGGVIPTALEDMSDDELRKIISGEK